MTNCMTTTDIGMLRALARQGDTQLARMARERLDEIHKSGGVAAVGAPVQPAVEPCATTDAPQDETPAPDTSLPDWV